MREEEYMQILIRLYEEKTGWGSMDEWGNYQFAQLSDSIWEKTGKRISDSTLKRIFGRKKTKTDLYSPHAYTKDILTEYIGFADWTHFRKEYRKEGAVAKQLFTPVHTWRRKFLSRRLLWVFFLIMIPGIFFFVSKIFSEIHDNPLKSMDCVNDIGTVPFTAVFKYELEDTEDSVLIDFGNNESFYLAPSRNMITQFYPGAGYPTIKVTKNGQLLCEKKVHVLSEGWQAGFSPSDTMLAYRPFEDREIMKSEGRLYITPEKLSASVIDITKPNFIEFRYFSKFNVAVDNLEFFTRVKNTREEGGKRCYDVEIILQGEKGDFIIRFLEPGCFRYARFVVGEKNYYGRFHDLSVFAKDVSEWRDIKIVIQEGEASIWFDQELTRKEQYNRQMGELKGIIYRFFGNGSVDYVKLSEGEDIFLEDDF